MDKVRIIEVKQSIFADNDRDADKLREELKIKKTFLLNLMSSPGSGKTTFLKGIIKRLRERIRLCKPRSRTRDITNAFYSFIKEILSIIYRKSLSKLNVQKTCEHS